MNWSFLAPAQPVPGGWDSTRLTPGTLGEGASVWIRAVGRYSSGLSNGSQSTLRYDQVFHVFGDRVFEDGFETTAAGSLPVD